MHKRNLAQEKEINTPDSTSTLKQSRHGRIFSISEEGKILDPYQLDRLEESFRDWVHAASKENVRASRLRILLVFILIRYTGAKLSEVLGLDPCRDIDFEKQCVRFGRTEKDNARHERVIPISEKLCREMQIIVDNASYKNEARKMLNFDPGFVRKKFYERAEDCGISKQLGAPEMLRRSRAVELMQNNLPLPAVQMVLGHSTPNLTTAFVSFSEEDINQVTRLFMERESVRKTSARNSFFGKIHTIHKGDIQTQIELVTLGGHQITTVITNDSVNRLGLKEGKLITAEVKAPWVMLHKSDAKPACSADNIFNGSIERIAEGKINTEYIVQISDGTEVCAIVTSESGKSLSLAEGDAVWVVFSGYAVVLLAE